MIENPKASIIIPVYNVEAYLEKCLDSAISQTLKDIEIIVVNDESTDNSLDIAQSYAANDPRIIIIDQKNKGLGGARNSGIDAAQGEYLFFLDSDDYIAPETIETLYSYAQTHTLDIVIFNYTKIDEQGIPIMTTDFGNAILSRDEAFREILSLKTSPMTCNKLYKHSLFTDFHIRYPEKFLHEDLNIAYKLGWYAKKVGFFDKSFYFWLTRTGSITQKFTFDHINDVISSLMQMKQFLKEHNAFETYKTEYIRGSMQMINLLMERSIRFCHQGTALMTYIKYIIDTGKVIDDNDIKQMHRYDDTLYKRFKKHYHTIFQTLNHDKPVETCTTKLINHLLPIRSKRRTLVKKILRRK